ncbi:MAG: hypothetical protein CSA04_04455 [Bacteroidetes bacterium]|nr:MAG: hypothetical protein CSA04_04455 [Bacteroidota bacterium]
MKHRIVLLLFLLWLLGGAACTPEREPSLPEIFSFHLLADDSLHALDTLSYALVVVSESPIRSVKLQLKREEGSVLLSHLVDESGAVRVDIGEGLFILSRKGLETGRYRFEVLVSNEDGSSKRGIPVDIQALAPEVWERYLLLGSGGQDTEVALLQEDLSLMPGWSLQGDFLDGALDCSADRMFTLGRKTGALNCRDLEEEMLLWSIPADHNPPFPSFMAFALTDQQVWVAKYRDHILGYDYGGVEKYRAWLSSEGFPQSLLITEDYVVAEEYAIASMKKVLSFRYRASGVLHEAFETDFEELLLLGEEGREVLYAGFREGLTTFFLYDPWMGERVRLFDVPGKMVHAVKGSAGAFILADDESRLYSFRPKYGFEALFRVAYEIRSLSYDPLNRELWVVAPHRTSL